MIYYFHTFSFDSIESSLHDGAIPKTISVNAASVLALLLSDPDSVFSKHEILETVWAGRVVSEQVVFQNISELRALLGEKSIKTFPRRGYKWQIPISLESPEVVEVPVSQSTEQTESSLTAKDEDITHAERAKSEDIDNDETLALAAATAIKNDSDLPDSSPATSSGANQAIGDQISITSGPSQAAINSTNQSTRPRGILYAAAAIILLGVFLALFTPHIIGLSKPDAAPQNAGGEKQKGARVIALVPFIRASHSDQDDALASTLLNKVTDLIGANNNFKARKESIETAAFLNFDNFRYVEKIQLEQPADFVLTATVRSYKEKLFAQYYFRGEARFWSGEVSAASVEGLAKALLEQLDIINTVQWLHRAANIGLYEAELRLIYNKYPNNLSVLDHFRRATASVNDHNTSVVLAKRLIRMAKGKSDSSYYEAQGNIGLGFNASIRGDIVDAERYLDKAKEIFKQTNDLKSLAYLNHIYAYHHLLNLNQAAAEAPYLEGLEYAQLAKQPGDEVSFLLSLSDLYHSLGKIEERDTMLYNAELLLDKYVFPPKNYALAYQKLGAHSEKRKDTERYYRRVLSLLEGEWDLSPAQNGALYLSKDGLLKMYIGDKRYGDAVSTFDRGEQTCFLDYYMLSRVYYDWGKLEKAKTYALQAFEGANLEGGGMFVALSSALVLFHVHKEQNNEAEKIHYQRFITDNPFPEWITKHKEILKRSGIPASTRRNI